MIDIRIGIVSSINYQNGSIKVAFPDKDNMVSKELPLLSFEYNVPNVGDTVLTIFYAKGRGICLGKFYSKDNLPSESGANIIKKDFSESDHIKYDKDTNTLTIKATNLVLEGNINISGNLDVEGNISAIGTINASNYPP